MIAGGGNHNPARVVASQPAVGDRTAYERERILQRLPERHRPTTSPGCKRKSGWFQEASGAATESVLTVGIDGNNRYIISVRAVTSYYTSVVNGWSET
jgi:hypothetical protein